MRFGEAVNFMFPYVFYLLRTAANLLGPSSFVAAYLSVLHFHSLPLNFVVEFYENTANARASPLPFAASGPTVPSGTVSLRVFAPEQRHK